MHRHVKTATFYAFCLLSGVGAAYCAKHLHQPKPSSTAPQATNPPPERGLAVAPPSDESRAAAHWREACARITSIRGNTLLTYIATTSDNQGYVPALAAQSAHAAGLKAALVYQIDLAPPLKPDAFAGYFTLAALAQDAGFDSLILGPARGDPEDSTENWQKLLHSVREHYHKNLGFLASVDQYYFIPWWESVDTIAISGPFPLPTRNKLTPHDFDLAWQAHLETITSFARHNSKPLLLLNPGSPQSPDLQGSNLAALLQATTGRPELQALFLDSRPLDSTLDPVIAKAWQGK